MSEEQINIAIAEAHGWTKIDGLSAKGLMGKPPGKPWPFDYLPDFCNDLNAMHEAVIKTFQDSSIQLDYSRMLIFVIKKSSPICKRFFSDFDLANATARQRAEAFLRTIGKWEETK
jgi:hypothetical protein